MSNTYKKVRLLSAIDEDCIWYCNKREAWCFGCNGKRTFKTRKKALKFINGICNGNYHFHPRGLCEPTAFSEAGKPLGWNDMTKDKRNRRYGSKKRRSWNAKILKRELKNAESF